jgi:AraC-like DNA-binding protein
MMRAAMDQILEHSKHTGKRPVIADVERRLGIARATFCRQFTALTDTPRPS